MEKETLAVLNELKSSGVQVSYWVYFWVGLISLIFSGLGAYLSSYLRKKGEQTAIIEDLDSIKHQLKHTTETIETVKASTSKNLHIEKSKWDFKKNIYYDLLINLVTLKLHARKYKKLLNNPEISEEEELALQGFEDALGKILKYEEVGGLFIEQSILNKISTLRDVFSGKDRTTIIKKNVWDDLAHATEALIKELRKEAKKDLFG